MHDSRVSIVILNWNGRDDTLSCLDSVSRVKWPNLDVLVVDNGSTDGSVAAIRDRYPTIETIETGRNLGFTGGNNVGIRRALELGADFLFLLNNDTEVDSMVIGALVRAASAQSDIGAMSAKIYHHEDRARIWFMGTRWNPRTAHFDHISHDTVDDSLISTTLQETDYASGCALFIPAERIREIGFLDEDFFLYFEETDWCYRARSHGYRCYVVPDAIVWHKVSSSIGGDSSPLREYFMTRNKLLWARKHLDKATRRRVWLALLKSTARPLVTIPVVTTKGNFGKKYLWAAISWMRGIRRGFADRRTWAALYGMRDYCLSRFGDLPEAVRARLQD